MSEELMCPMCDVAVQKTDSEHAVCPQCGEVYEIIPDEEISSSEFTSDIEPESNFGQVTPLVLQLPPIEEVVQQIDEKPTDVNVENPEIVCDAGLSLKSQNGPQLKSEQLDDSDIPNAIKNSSAWRYAKITKKKGNPYRPDCNNWKIFEIFRTPCTVSQAVSSCVELGLTNKLSFLLSLYEVIRYCSVCGLLYIDDNGVISIVPE